MLLISVVEQTVFSVVTFTCGQLSFFSFPSASLLWQQAVRHRMQMVGLYPSNLTDLFYFLYARATTNERQCGFFFFLSLSPFPVPFADDSNDPIQSGDWESPAGPPPFPFVNVWCNITSVRTPYSSLSLLYLFSFSFLPDYTGLL